MYVYMSIHTNGVIRVDQQDLETVVPKVYMYSCMNIYVYTYIHTDGVIRVDQQDLETVVPKVRECIMTSLIYIFMYVFMYLYTYILME
jgi:uncharacterized membrane protein (Fun14 family)